MDKYTTLKRISPIDMAKVDKRAAGHSTKHEIPVLISADAKMVDTKFVCTASTCIHLCKT